MNFEFITHRMAELGWKKPSSGVFAGERFNLVASRRFGIVPWMVMLKTIPVLDIFALNKLQGQLELVFFQAKGNVWQRNFYLYLVCAKATQQALHALKMDTIRVKHYSQPKTGTRKIMVVDEFSRQIYGPYPPRMEYEQEPPFDLGPIFMQALMPDGAAYPLPAVQEDVDNLADRLLPASVLNLIQESGRTDLGLYRVEALHELGRLREAGEILDIMLPGLQGDELARARRFKAQHLFSDGQVDEGIWLLEQAEQDARSPNVRATVISTKANGYGLKRCFNLAENAIRAALQVAPDEPRVIFAQSALYLQMDLRIEARAVLERMRGDSEPWVNCWIDFDLANIALLLGEFDEAGRLAVSALDYSPEIINPLNILAYLAMLKGDLQEMERLSNQIEERSPQADFLPLLKTELERLRKRHTGAAKAPQARLESFPSLVQRRNYCGPSTIELVLRYWKGGLDLTNSDIARRVMQPQTGTPIHRMTEFFRLLGFNSLRCIVPTDKLKQLVDEGFPAIVEVQGGGHSHVTVVIGYDDEAGTIELQDPMTHQVIPIPIKDFNDVRQTPFNSAIVAHPASSVYEDTLARLGLFPDDVLALIDQASRAFEVGNHSLVNDLMQRAVQLRPQHGLAWSYWLQAILLQWQEAQHHFRFLPPQPGGQDTAHRSAEEERLRGQFYAVLERARQAHPQAEFIYFNAGQAALLDGDLPLALAAFQKAHDLSPKNSETMAGIAECQYKLRQVEQALESAGQAVKLDPASVTGNIWLSRCLSNLQKEHAAYFARVGLEQASPWWLAHQAMAEAHLSNTPPRDAWMEYHPINLLNPAQEAWHEVDAVLSRFPNQPEALYLRASALMGGKDFAASQAALETALAAARQLNAGPMAFHKVHLGLCLLFFVQGLLVQATEQVLKMLEAEPDDPWALQLQASIEFRKLVLRSQQTNTGEAPELDVARAIELYLSAIHANQGAPGVVHEFLGYLLQLGRRDEAVTQSAQLQEKYPDQPDLIYEHAVMLRVAGKQEDASLAMQRAVSIENVIKNQDALCYAFETIFQGIGPERGEKAVLGISLPKNITTRQRDRALGIILSFYPKEKGQRARQLLEAILADNPEDGEATFWLGRGVAMNDDERERMYRQSVLLMPQWTHARMTLASYLAQKNRYQEALDFTIGHEYESLDMLTLHLYCLNRTGRFEEASFAAERLISDPSLPGERNSFHYQVKEEADTCCGEFEKALSNILKAMELFPGEQFWYYRECLALCNLHRFDEAEAALAAGVDKGMDAHLFQEGHYWIALVRENLDSALELARLNQDVERKELAAQKNPPGVMHGAWGSRYLVLLAHLGHLKEAEKYLEKVFSETRIWPDAANELSKTRANELTLKCAEQALKLNKNVARNPSNALLGRAIAYRNTDHPKARQSFEQLRERFPGQSDAYVHLSLCAALDGDLEKAALLAEQAVAFDRRLWSVWAAHGLVKFLSGEREAAAQDLKKGWARTPDETFTGYPFWWLYFALCGDQALAEKWKGKAFSQAESAFDHQLLNSIQSHLV